MWVLCCVLVAIPANCVFPSFCVVVAAFTFEVSGQEMGGDGIQTQKRKSWIPGQHRAEKVLADAITIDGRKEWICKFCSGTNVWTSWRCRPCYSNTQQEKYRQAISAKTRGGRQDHHLRLVEKERSPETRMRRLKNCDHRLNSSEGSRERRRSTECKVIRREEKTVLSKTGKWRLMRRSTTSRSWTSREGGRFRISRTWIRCSGTGRKRSGRESYWRLSRRDTNSCRNTREGRKGLKRCRVSRIRRNLHKEAGACEEEMRKVREEIYEREVRYLEF